MILTVELPCQKMKAINAKKQPAKAVARAERLFLALSSRYPNAHCELNWTKPHELLIATILSAQSTDVGVNKATPALFKKFPTPVDFANATPAEIEPFVNTLNFWRNKAKAVRESMRIVCEQFNGEVPRSMDELLTLRGVARKTANVVLGNVFHMQEGVVVDTHVGRLALRMGLTKHTDPLLVESDLMGLFERKNWCQVSHLFIAHGRASCKARGATCESDSICQQFCANAKVKSSPVLKNKVAGSAIKRTQSTTLKPGSKKAPRK